MQSTSPLEFKSCCANLYSNKTLLLLLGPSLHPGGLSLTEQLANQVGLSSGDVVLDLASGTGVTTMFLATKYGCEAQGVDLSWNLVKHASDINRDENARFLQSDAENLPFKDGAFTATVSECSLCLFPDPQQGLLEIKRTLRPKGRLGLTDFAVRGQLPNELDNVLASLLCLSQKVSPEEYENLVEQAGFEKVRITDCSGSLAKLLDGVRRRLLIAELLQGTGNLSLSREQVAKAKLLVGLADASVREGHLGYLLLTAQKP